MKLNFVRFAIWPSIYNFYSSSCVMYKNMSGLVPRKYGRYGRIYTWQFLSAWFKRIAWSGYLLVQTSNLMIFLVAAQAVLSFAFIFKTKDWMYLSKKFWCDSIVCMGLNLPVGQLIKAVSEADFKVNYVNFLNKNAHLLKMTWTKPKGNIQSNKQKETW